MPAPQTAPAIVRRNTTQARISFFTHDKENNRLDAFNPDSPNGGPSSLMSFTFSKRLGEAAGTCEITLKPYKETDLPAGTRGQPWTDLIKEGDWWAIDIVKNQTVQGVSFGVIDEIALNITAGMHGEASGSVVVTGRDIGFALEDTPIYFNPLDPTIDNALGINMIAILDQIAGKPHEVVVNMIRGLMGGGGVDAILGGHIEVPRGLGAGSTAVRWVDLVDFETCVNPNLRGAVFAANALTPEGAPTVWDFVQQWRNPAMNELFLDAVPTPGFPKKANLMLREKPFFNTVDAGFSPWHSLTTWNIEASMVKDLSLTRGSNRINHVVFSGDLLPGLGNDTYGIYLPLADVDSIKRYGLHRLEETTRYFDDTGESGFATESKEWLYLVVSWNALNHEYWQGSIKLAEMRAAIRVGQRITLVNGPPAGYAGLPGASAVPFEFGAAIDQRGFSFYVEGVTLSYTEGEQPTCETELMVSRGFEEGARLAHLNEAVDRFEIPIRVGAIPGTQLNVLPDVDMQQLDPTGLGGAYADGDHTVLA